MGALIPNFSEMVLSERMEDWENLMKHSTDELQGTLDKTRRRRERELKSKLNRTKLIL